MKLLRSHPRYASLDTLLRDVRACRVCDAQLPAGARPVVRASRDARLLIVGQAPGAKVHASGVPWNDVSGKRLRDWLGMTEDEFYDTSRVAIIPMGFCYPGRGASGDNPPRPECAQLWLEPLLSHLPRIELTLLVGHYAQRHFLGSRCQSSLTETVRAWAEYAPAYVPLPHPSPRNQLWFKRHPWFADQVLPMLKQRIVALFGVPPR